MSVCFKNISLKSKFIDTYLKKISILYNNYINQNKSFITKNKMVSQAAEQIFGSLIYICR